MAPQKVDGAPLLLQELHHHALRRHTEEAEIAVLVLSPNEKLHDDLPVPIKGGVEAMVVEEVHLPSEIDLTMALLARMADLDRQLKHHPCRGNAV